MKRNKTIKYDAINSPGYPVNSTTISAEKVELLKRLAEKASKTFPLPFSDIPQKEDIFNEGIIQLVLIASCIMVRTRIDLNLRMGIDYRH